VHLCLLGEWWASGPDIGVPPRGHHPGSKTPSILFPFVSLAVFSGSLELVRERLRQGAAVDACCRDGRTALWWACRYARTSEHVRVCVCTRIHMCGCACNLCAGGWGAGMKLTVESQTAPSVV
jgi:hypothetical protein